MVTLCWAAKGGSGTTVVATALALESVRPALVVDLAGDVPMVLGTDASDRPGALDWLAATGGVSQLDDLLIEIDDTTTLLSHRRATPAAATRWPAATVVDLDLDIDTDIAAARTHVAVGDAIVRADPGHHGSGLDGHGQHDAGLRDRTGSTLTGHDQPGRLSALVAWLADWESRTSGDCWIDAGTGVPPQELADATDDRWLVTRACYVSITRAARCPVRPTGVILVDEPGRRLRRVDIERAVGAPIITRIDLDPAVARAVDAGLLASRPPRLIRRSLRRVSA